MMEPLCIALTTAIQGIGDAIATGKPYLAADEPPTPTTVQRRNPELCTGLLWLADEFLSSETALETIKFESPIERSMAIALAGRRGAFGLRVVPLAGMEYAMCRQFARIVLPSTESGAAIYPQVEFGPYWLDFLLLFRNSGGDVLGIAVECDGHDFHEKTKQQAARDKKRDRFIALHSIPMMRFTGAEIFYGAPACAEEVHRAMLFVQAGPREKVWPGYLSAAALADLEWQEADEEMEREARREQEEEEEKRRFLEECEGYYP